MKKNMKKNEPKIVNAEGRTLGRVASEAATLLIGKDKTSFERNKFSGSKVNVINASKIKITSKKLEDIAHSRYSGYPGGLRVTTAKETIAKKGYSELIKLSIYRMLPGNKLKKEMLKHLTITD